MYKGVETSAGASKGIECELEHVEIHVNYVFEQWVDSPRFCTGFSTTF
nr:MAG TPA: hypothetical protein [Caudoviricetes sp.]DAX80111.1 MAG TPA: hypothetical protein [Caudoviricetes sp.]